MWGLLFTTAVYLASVAAHWGTYYSFDEGLIYLQLKNDDLVALNFSIAGFTGLSASASASVNLKQNQQIHSLNAPPQNSSMFVYGSSLYAFTGAVDATLSDYDGCGDGIFQLLKYESGSDAWVHASDNMTFSDVDDVSFYQDSTYFTSTGSSNIYIYGGRCAATGTITNRLLSFDMDTMSFANITTSTRPQGFYGGSSLWAPSPQQSFVIGGRSVDGWLNMYQLATWNFQSGWSFQGIQENGTTVASRINALVLPVFGVLSDNSVQTFNKNYNPTSVLVLGGESATADDAPWAKLAYSDNQWSWQSLDTDLKTSDILGAAVIFNTLVVVNGSSTGKNTRSGNTYQLNLYDITSDFASVGDLKSNTAANPTENNKPGSLSKTTKVLVGTLVPVSALAVLFGLAMFLWRRKVSKDEASVADPLDYQLGHYRTRSDQQYSLLGSRPLDLYQQANDTNSTLDVASIDSWVRKRQEYDATHQRPMARQSFLASNETLGSHPEISDEISGEISGEIYDETHDEPHDEPHDETASDITEMAGHDAATVKRSTEAMPEMPNMPMIASPSVNFSGADKSPKKSALPVRLSQTRSFSYTHTPPQSPMVQRKSRLDPGFIHLGEGVDLGARDHSDGESPDENMDVQVLVSSKRKSVLRVVNPDMECGAEGVRLRNPSK